MERIFEDYQRMKRDAVDSDEVDNDIPMLLYVGEGPIESDTQVVVIVIPTNDRNDLCQALAACMARMFIPHWATICMDGYTAADADVPEQFMHIGGLREMAALGVNGVKECLTVTAVDHVEGTYTNSRSYWYDDDGDIWFDDEEGPTADATGPMIEVLVDIVSMYGKTQAEILIEILSRTTDMN